MHAKEFLPVNFQDTERLSQFLLNVFQYFPNSAMEVRVVSIAFDLLPGVGVGTGTEAPSVVGHNSATNTTITASRTRAFAKDFMVFLWSPPVVKAIRARCGEVVQSCVLGILTRI